MTKRPSSVLVACESPQGVSHAIRRGASVASQLRKPLTLFHAIPALPGSPFQELPGSSRSVQAAIDTANAMMSDTARKLRTDLGIDTDTFVAVGNCIDLLLGLADTCDLLVVGVRGKRALADRVLGTATERIVRLFPKPVLLVRNQTSDRYKTVLVPVDFEAGSLAAAQAARELAPDAKVELLHVVGPQCESPERAAAAPREHIVAQQDRDETTALCRLQRLALALPASAGFTTSIAHGVPSEACLARQKSGNFGLVAVGRDGSATLGNFLLGRVAAPVICNAGCDVLVAPRRRSAVVRAAATAHSPPRCASQ
ncbi:universal stress protein [Caldimonas brevitalea]|uniref:UspA domain-containing protein n=1 Tax=Caldimonas brevitalea TaxID=413882 RepID=A0A0G3BQ10_9BURK|nr:universal stress protein [Caldimonas brevitalea]AKJ30073.1 hypothetical protein AAW51_3382 [Caldimonas brevitalea]